ncbi:MAG: amidohydrolase family protein [Phycisphaerae bacterium]|nr:amidohydrolase family protein [Phycisphaerae bacterium]
MEKDWNFFDARCKVGRNVKTGVGPLSPHTAEDLLAEMDHFGVAEAMVLDCLSVECSPWHGNPRTIEAAGISARLHPAWVVIPPGTDEQPDPDQLIALMQQKKVGAVYLFPRQYRFPLASWSIDEVLEPLASLQVPVFISYDEVGPDGRGGDQTDWDEVVSLCRRMPSLPVIVTELRIRRSQRTVYRALEACANLHLELSGYWLHRGIEYLTRRWGSERLLFGSNWPTLGHGLTLTTLACAQVDDQAKRQIAGDNLRRLLQWCHVEHPRVDLLEPQDELVAWGRTGQKPEGIRLYDNHGHIGGSSGHYHVPDGDVNTLVHEMDRFGIEKVCLFSLVGVFTDEVHGNNHTIDAVQRHPERFIGFTLVNPHRGPDGMRRELERCAKAGLRGIKLIPTYQCYPEEGPNIDIACEWANGREQLILNHYWGGAAQIERLVATYPKACFFTGHTTTAYAEVMKKYANLYVCTCPVLEPRAVEQVVDAIGADRFLFGSDLTDLPIAWGIGPILFARLGERQRRMILGENLRALLQRYSLKA